MEGEDVYDIDWGINGNRRGRDPGAADVWVGGLDLDPGGLLRDGRRDDDDDGVSIETGEGMGLGFVQWDRVLAIGRVDLGAVAGVGIVGDRDIGGRADVDVWLGDDCVWIGGAWSGEGSGRVGGGFRRDAGAQVGSAFLALGVVLVDWVDCRSGTPDTCGSRT